MNDQLGKKEEKGNAKNDKRNQPKGEGKGAGSEKKPENGTGQKPEPKGERKNQPKDGARDAGQGKSPGQNNQGKATPPSEKGQPKPEPKGRTGNGPNQGTPGKEGNEKGQGSKKLEPGQGQAPGGKKDLGEKGGGQTGQQKGPGGNGQPGPQAGSGKKEGDGNSPRGTAGQPKGKGQPGVVRPNQQDTGSAKGDGDAQPRGHVKPKNQGDPSAQTAPGTTKSNAPLEHGQDPRGGSKAASPKQVKGSGGAKGEGSAGSDSTREDAAQAARDLQSGDANKREEALRQLRNMVRNAKDPQVRKDAGKTLDENGPRAGSAPKGNENNPANNATPPRPGSGKPAEDQPQGSAGSSGTGKSNGRNPPRGTDPTANAENAPKTPKTDEGEGNPKTDDSQATGPGKPGGQNPGSGSPKGGRGSAPEGGERPEFFNPEDTDAAKMTTADLRHKLHAGELQLKKFKEEVTPEMLKELKMSQAEYEQFLKEYNRRLKEGWATLHEMEKLDRPQTGNAPRANPGIVRTDPNARKTNDALQSGGPLLPPSEYRRQYQEFTQDLSRLRPRGDKK